MSITSNITGQSAFRDDLETTPSKPYPFTAKMGLKLINKAKKNLSLNQRKVLYYRTHSNMSWIRISNLLRISIPRTKKLYHQAVKIIKQELNLEQYL